MIVMTIVWVIEKNLLLIHTWSRWWWRWRRLLMAVAFQIHLKKETTDHEEQDPLSRVLFFTDVFLFPLLMHLRVDMQPKLHQNNIKRERERDWSGWNETRHERKQMTERPFFKFQNDSSSVLMIIVMMMSAVKALVAFHFLLHFYYSQKENDHPDDGKKVHHSVAT